MDYRNQGLSDRSVVGFVSYIRHLKIAKTHVGSVQGYDMCRNANVPRRRSDKTVLVTDYQALAENKLSKYVNDAFICLATMSAHLVSVLLQVFEP